MKNRLTRREFLRRASVFGAGFIFFGLPISAFAERERGRERGRARGRGESKALPFSLNNPSVQINDNCRNCGKCQKFCKSKISVFGQSVSANEEACIYCGQCTLFCPAITEQYHYQEVAKAIADTNKIVMASTAPAIRVALGEMYKFSAGTNVEKKIIGSLKKLGVDYVLDTTFSADLTVMEETAELLQRLENNAKNTLPMFTSCCPGWVRCHNALHCKKG